MSNIDKQALREEFQYMQDHYSDPADRDRQIIYIAAEALLDELEKAQRANVAQDDHINQQQDRIEQLEKGHKEAAKQINSWRRLAKQNIAERGKDISELEAARQRIAELEARTVTLPPKEHDNGTDSQIYINAGFANRMRQKCADAIRAAGIGVKGA